MSGEGGEWGEWRGRGEGRGKGVRWRDAVCGRVGS